MGWTVFFERYDCRNAGRNCRYFLRYKMNLLEVRDSDRYVFNNTDVQSVFEITRETFAGHFDKIREKYGTKELGADLQQSSGK